jgi:hypothetical protein
VIHPFLVVLPTLLALIRENLAMTAPRSGLYVYLVFCGLAAVLMALLQQLLGNLRKAGAITSLLILAALTSTAAGVWSWVPATALLVLCVLIVALPGQLYVLTTFLNLTAAIAVAFPIYQIARAEIEGGRPTFRRDYLSTDAIETRQATKDSPDIYYIVLDGYGRSDVLWRLFQLRNELPAQLEERGFYVAESAHSNYSQTALSFAATLNMDWIPHLLSDADAGSQWRRPLTQLIDNNRIVDTLRRAGYRIISYPGEYAVTHLDNDDATRHPWVYFTELEYTLLSGTVLDKATRLLGFDEKGLTEVVRRNHVRWTLTDLRQGHDGEAPAFVYVHLVVPHPPFLFRPDGSYRPSSLKCTIFDGSHWRTLAEGTGETYVEGYRDSVEYLDDMLIQAVDGIFASSRRPPIIVIQGDHGPGSKLDWDSLEGSDLQERMAILSAYYFPDQDYSRLRPSITPINTFRVILEQYLGAALPQLEDRIYFNTWQRPYDPVDVTDRLGTLG